MCDVLWGNWQGLEELYLKATEENSLWGPLQLLPRGVLTLGVGCWGWVTLRLEFSSILEIYEIYERPTSAHRISQPCSLLRKPLSPWSPACTHRHTQGPRHTDTHRDTQIQIHTHTNIQTHRQTDRQAHSTLPLHLWHQPPQSLLPPTSDFFPGLSSPT